MKLKSNPALAEVINGYEPMVAKRLLELRKLILEVAKEMELDQLEETLKWREPSFLSPKGSTVRIDWKKKRPEEFAIFFKCTSKIVPTIRAVYGDFFNYENNRALWFSLDEKLPKKELKTCVRMALDYHNLKHLPKLGMD